jgi:hypothetical protein
MASRADFTSEEWWQLSEAPLAVAMYVAGADTRTGPVGTIKELSAPFKLAAKQLNTAGASSLLGELLLTWSTKLKDDAKKPEGAQDVPAGEGSTDVDLLAFVKGVGALLDAKAPPADAGAVKAWLVSAARASAESGKEGAVLGIGGEKVSGAESKAVAEIALALGVTA